MIDVPVLPATRYVQPLREGGSLPAVVDTDDGLYVAKFRGAGQGAKALVAELIAGLLARALDLPIPDVALIGVAPLFGKTEPDPEIQDILKASRGMNVGLRYLDGAFNFDALAAGELVDPELAARIVWFDALLTNPDRTARNPNLLVWQRKPWLIDHGAVLYAHHDWSKVDEARARTPFPLSREHVLLSCAGDLEEADAALAPRVGESLVEEVTDAIPDELLADAPGSGDREAPDALRERYRTYLSQRLRSPRHFLGEAIRARDERAKQPPQRLSARR